MWCDTVDSWTVFVFWYRWEREVFYSYWLQFFLFFFVYVFDISHKNGGISFFIQFQCLKFPSWDLISLNYIL